jgi:hypothetical protein
MKESDNRLNNPITDSCIVKECIKTVLTAIPYLGSIASSGYELVEKCLRRAFFKKWIGFMGNPDTIPQKDRELYIKKLDSGKSVEICEKMMILIDRLDCVEKAVLLGKAFKYLIMGRITEHQFFEVGYAIDRCFYEDIVKIDKMTNAQFIINNDDMNYYLNDPMMSRLLGSGIIASGKYGQPLTRIGKLLISIYRE